MLSHLLWDIAWVDVVKGPSVEENTRNYLLLLKTRTQHLTWFLFTFLKMFPSNTKIYTFTNLMFNNRNSQDSWKARNMLFDINVSFFPFGDRRRAERTEKLRIQVELEILHPAKQPVDPHVKTVLEFWLSALPSEINICLWCEDWLLTLVKMTEYLLWWPKTLPNEKGSQKYHHLACFVCWFLNFG